MNNPKVVSKSEFFVPIDQKLKKAIMRTAKKYEATQIISIAREDGKSEIVFAGPDLQWENWRDILQDDPKCVIERVYEIL